LTVIPEFKRRAGPTPERGEFCTDKRRKVATAKQELRKITTGRSDAKDFGNKIQPNQ
jgi:hypothetical protein